MKQRTGNMANEISYREHAEVDGVGAKKVVLLGTDGNQVAPGALYTRLIDDQSPILYVGEAAPGSGTDEPVWRIKRIEEDGMLTTIAWANSTTSFSSIWDDREGLTYS